MARPNRRPDHRRYWNRRHTRLQRRGQTHINVNMRAAHNRADDAVDSGFHAIDRQLKTAGEIIAGTRRHNAQRFTGTAHGIGSKRNHAVAADRHQVVVFVPAIPAFAKESSKLSPVTSITLKPCLRPASCSSSTTCLPTSAPLPLFDVGLPTTATVAFTHDVSLILQYDNRDSLHTPHANGFPYKWPRFVERMFLYVERSLFTKRDFPHNVPFRTTLIRRQSAPPVTVCRHAIRMAFACRPALRPAHPRLLSCRIRSSHYCRI